MRTTQFEWFFFEYNKRKGCKAPIPQSQQPAMRAVSRDFVLSKSGLQMVLKNQV